MFVEEIRRRAETAPRAALPAVVAALWGAFAEGKVTEAEAEALSVLIESRRLSEIGPRYGQIPNPTGTGDGEGTADPRTLVQAARRAVGSRPRTVASLERRRRLAAAGRMPPGIAARFTLAEQAVLALVATETGKRGDCRLAIEALAAIAGVSRSTVKTAIREAARLGLLTVEERRITGFRNDTNVVRIVAPEWLAWMRLGRRSDRPGGGVKSSTGTDTGVLESGKTSVRAGRRTPPRKPDRPQEPRRPASRTAENPRA